MTSRLELKVKEFAERERVTERTVYAWIAKGAVQVRRTPGGGLRILTPQDEADDQLKTAEEFRRASR